MLITQDRQRFHWSALQECSAWGCSRQGYCLLLRDLWIIITGMFGVSVHCWPLQTDMSPHVAMNTPSTHKDAILSGEQSRVVSPNPALSFFPSLPLLRSPMRIWMAGNTLYQETIYRVERVSLCSVSQGVIGGKWSLSSFLPSGNQSLCSKCWELDLQTLCNVLHNSSEVEGVIVLKGTPTYYNISLNGNTASWRN